MKNLFNPFQTFRVMNEMQAEAEKPKIHYLQARLNRLQKLAQLARSDKNDFKLKQATRLIFLLNNRLSANSQLLMAHIELKRVNN
jgi:hypothetical protein